MAIIYSYPTDTNILGTDILIGTTTKLVAGKAKNQTKSYAMDNIADFVISNIPRGTLTTSNDTNITLTLGGIPVNSLFSNVSITVGWNGLLADNRIASASYWNSKQDALSGTGIVKSTAGNISYLTDNSANWDTAYNDKINSASVTGTTTKTLTLTQQDGGAITTSWVDATGAAWGQITGVLSNQTDLQNALNGKVSKTGNEDIYGNKNFLGLTFIDTLETGTIYAYGDVTTENGDFTGNAFKIPGGTSSQFLMADGSVNPGGFITSLTGEATATGPGSANVTLNNASVTSKVLTGLNITGGTVSSTDSILTGFGKLQNQISGLVSGATYQGVWNASTNTPALASSIGTNGFYYVVNVAGNTNLNGITDWKVGDWAIFHGSTWQKVDNTDAVSSVNGQVGAVSLTTDNIPEGASNLYFSNLLSRTAISLTTNGTSGAATYNSTTGVLNIPQYTVDLSGYVPNTRTITIDGITQDLSTNRTYNILPTGGSLGQVLTKNSNTNYDVSWTTPPVSTIANDVQNTVKAGVAINKGQAVYVTGADGTNIIVGLASNTSEATSSKTLGLLNATVAINGTADVIQIGKLSGLNTIGANVGDPVWLGTNGNLIYGLANKPYAPAHLVFIGIVTRVNANNGEIFITVQNGFELKEIHDVDIATNVPINGDILGYDGTLWVNKTIAEWLGYTPANAALTISTTAPLQGGGNLSANRTLSITQATTSTNGYLSSTDWNTFNSKQNALTNPITGTGTINTIPKFTGAGALGDSFITDDGTNITITPGGGVGTFGIYNDYLNILLPTGTPVMGGAVGADNYSLGIFRGGGSSPYGVHIGQYTGSYNPYNTLAVGDFALDSGIQNGWFTAGDGGLTQSHWDGNQIISNLIVNAFNTSLNCSGHPDFGPNYQSSIGIQGGEVNTAIYLTSYSPYYSNSNYININPQIIEIGGGSTGTPYLQYYPGGSFMIRNNSTAVYNDGVTKLGVYGGIRTPQYRLSALNTAPASATASGAIGEIRYTTDYIYVCVATNTWKRTALTTW